MIHLGHATFAALDHLVKRKAPRISGTKLPYVTNSVEITGARKLHLALLAFSFSRFHHFHPSIGPKSNLNHEM